MNHLDDIELIELAQARDALASRAYAVVFERYRARLGGYLRLQLSGDKSLADDMIQDVFIKSWSNIVSLKEPAKYYSWISMIARNTFMDHLRSKQRQSILHDWLALESDEVEEPQSDGDLESLLFGLDVEERDIVLMRSVMELSFDEISKALNISLSAAKMRYYRALEQLKSRH